MVREFRHALDDIAGAIHGIQAAAIGRTLPRYQSDGVLKHAIQRGIEIISEASRALPTEITALRPDVPWPRVRAIGNVLRHEYHGLSDRIIWGVVEDELPRLKNAIDLLRQRFEET